MDSSVLIAWFRQQQSPKTDMLGRLVGEKLLLIGDLILMEILQGARSDSHAAQLERRLQAFETASMVDHTLVLEAARNFRTLRGLGITLRKQIDLLIGTFCIAHGHELLHADRDFEPMERHLGLRVAGGPDTLH